MVRIVVGNCAQCGREMRVREHGIKETMHLTCKCGAQNLINPPLEIVERAKKVAAELRAEKERTAFEKRQEQARQEQEERLAYQQRIAEEHEQKRQLWMQKNEMLSSLMGVKDFLAWKIAKGNIWGPYQDPLSHPPIYPETVARLHAEGKIGNRAIAFHEYQLQYRNEETGVTHVRQSFTFLVNSHGDVKGLQEGIEEMIAQDEGFYSLATTGALNKETLRALRRYDPIEKEFAASIRHLSTMLAQFYATILWPELSADSKTK